MKGGVVDLREKKTENFAQVALEMYVTAVQIRRIERILRGIADKSPNIVRDYMTDGDLEYLKRDFESQLEHLKAQFPSQYLDIETLEKLI